MMVSKPLKNMVFIPGDEEYDESKILRTYFKIICATEKFGDAEALDGEYSTMLEALKDAVKFTLEARSNEKELKEEFGSGFIYYITKHEVDEDSDWVIDDYRIYEYKTGCWKVEIM